MVISVKQDSHSLSGLEVYLTKEPEVEIKKISNSLDSDDNNFADNNSDFNSDEKFKLLNGETVQIDYYDEMFDNSYEYDYQDISCNANVSMPRVDNNFFKGKKLSLLKEWENPNEKLQWKNLKKVITGFITEQSYTEEGVTLKIAGITKLLDQEKQFSFTQQKISVILKEMIESAGLKAEIDVKGLDDKLIDYTNISSSGSGGSVSSTGSATLDEVVKNAIKGKTTDLEKAKAIDSAFKSHVYYAYYSDCHFSDLEEAWNNAHLNCADGANVLCAMFLAAGLQAVIIHITNHYIVKVTINGKSYLTDSSGAEGSHNKRAFGDVFTYDGNTNGSEVGTRIPM